MSALFAGYGFIRSPVPGVNEPHYLSKARHLWDPAWCPDDVFLRSANAHAVFLWVCGGLASILPLTVVAVLGRIVVWICLAAGFERLCRSLALDGRRTVVAGALFLGVSSLGSLAGEWIVGGVEAKGFAWAALWMALAAVLQGRGPAVALWAGASTSLHPVVGVWGTLACLGASAFRDGFPALRWPLQRAALLTAAWILAALPGLAPAVMMLNAPATAAARADEIHVTIRLGHHLDPLDFPLWGWWLAGGELAVCLVLWIRCRDSRFRPAWRGLEGAVLAALVIALGGLTIGLGPRLYGLMKFYPYRLLDGLLPLAVAVGLAGQAPRGSPFRSAIVPFLAALGFLGSLLILPADVNPSRMDPNERQDWIAACRWISANTPPDAMFVTPRYSHAFKWYAERSEYVANKDVPQDAQGIIEWQRRREWLADWRKRAKDSRYSTGLLAELRRQTGATYLLASTDLIRALAPLHRNAHFEVFELPK